MISTDQSVYVKGRFIGHNIQIVEHIIYYANITNNDSIIAMPDFEKAFDSIEWDLIFEVLIKYNLCKYYINGFERYTSVQK